MAAAALALSGTAVAHTTDNPTVAAKSVQYQCQQGKKIKVRYGFNKQGLPTYASALINGQKRMLPINLSRSDNVDTVFGKEGGYVLSAGQLDRKNYRQSSMMITAPNDEIVYKDCSVRR